MHLSKQQLLSDLFCAYRDARKHKRNKNTQLRFEINLEDNLVELRDELFERRYKPSRAKCFIVKGPVKREIFSSSFRDRIVYHLIYNYVSPFFERRLIFDSYSCRKGKGTSCGVARLRHHIKSCTDNYQKQAYILKMDIKGYFMHINKEMLAQMVFSSIDKYKCQKCTQDLTWDDVVDMDFAKYLLQEIINWDPVADCVFGSPFRMWEGLPKSKRLTCAPKGYGLPIGDLTSQLFSNIYMDVFDQWVKRDLGIKHYGRYVDDFYIIHNDRDFLQSLIPRITSFLKERLKLDVNPRKTILRPACYGIEFLGTYVLPYCNFPTRRVVYEFKTFVSSTDKKCSVPDFSLSDALTLLPQINSRFGYISKFSSFRMMYSSLLQAPHLWSKFCFNASLSSSRIRSLLHHPREFPQVIDYLFYSELCRFESRHPLHSICRNRFIGLRGC